MTDQSLPPPLPTAGTRRSRRGRRAIFVFVSLVLFVALLLFAVFVVFPLAGRPLLKHFSVPTTGMAPTIKKGDIVAGEGFSLWNGTPTRGDVIIFKVEGIEGVDGVRGAKPNTVYVQRIAALGGDTVEVQPGKVLVNGIEFVIHSEGQELHYEGNMGDFFRRRGTAGKFTVPEGHVFTLGDNTHNSYDGRFWGCLPVKNIQMRARWRIAPVDRQGEIR